MAHCRCENTILFVLDVVFTIFGLDKFLRAEVKPAMDIVYPLPDSLLVVTVWADTRNEFHNQFLVIGGTFVPNPQVLALIKAE